jgi:hypothetical protein
VLDGYLAGFDRFAGELAARGIRLVAVKTPLPARVQGKLPGEAAFDARVRTILERHGFALHDFSGQGNDDAFFYDTDHLNREGAANFTEKLLAPLLRDSLSRPSPEEAPLSGVPSGNRGSPT